jgi:hypothetical protein
MVEQAGSDETGSMAAQMRIGIERPGQRQQPLSGKQRHFVKSDRND